jgi:hypothetical protein
MDIKMCNSECKNIFAIETGTTVSAGVIKKCKCTSLETTAFSQLAREIFSLICKEKKTTAAHYESIREFVVCDYKCKW